MHRAGARPGPQHCQGQSHRPLPAWRVVASPFPPALREAHGELSVVLKYLSPPFKPFLVTWDAAIKFPGQPMGSCPQDILLSLRRAGVVTLQQGECRPLWVPTRLCKSPSHTLK